METTLLEKKIAGEQRIMKILKVSEIRYTLANTNLGPIEAVVRFGEDKYHITLDASPVDSEKNEALLKIFGLNQ